MLKKKGIELLIRVFCNCDASTITQKIGMNDILILINILYNIINN